MYITDPIKQAQFESDLAEGIVPIWNPNDEDAANAYAAYFNNLMEADVCVITATTTYSHEFTEPETPE